MKSTFPWELEYFYIVLWESAAAAAKVSSVMSDSVRPHRCQPTRLLHPWDSQGKNTGMGGHFLLQCMKVKSESEVSQLWPTLCNPMDCGLPGSSVHGIFQARVLKWVAISFSRGSSRPRDGIRVFCMAESPLSHLGSQGIAFYWKMETPALHGVRWAVVTEIHSHGLEMCF